MRELIGHAERQPLSYEVVRLRGSTKAERPGPPADQVRIHEDAGGVAQLIRKTLRRDVGLGDDEALKLV